MKNKENFLDEFIKSDLNWCDFIKKNVLKEDCDVFSCETCALYVKEWLEQEYKEPIVLTE